MRFLKSCCLPLHESNVCRFEFTFAQKQLIRFDFCKFLPTFFQYSIKTRYIPGFIDKVIKDLRVDPTQSTV